MIPQKEDLIKKINESLEVVSSKYSETKTQLDHAGYVLESNEEMNKLDNELRSIAKLIVELPHSGRTLWVYELNKPENINGNELKYLEFYTAKPAKIGKFHGWEHISYIVDNFDNFIKNNAESENAIDKIRQIKGDRFGYKDLESFRIQFRNKSIKEITSEENSNEIDYQKLYETEKDSKLRILADIDNERKRMERQKDEFMKMSNIALMKDLFEIADDMNRSLQTAENDSYKMIYNKLLGIFNNYGFVPIDAKPGDDFDATKMEAISTVKTDADQDNKIVHVDQIGFVRKEDNLVVRHCKVIVGKSS